MIKLYLDVNDVIHADEHANCVLPVNFWIFCWCHFVFWSKRIILSKSCYLGLRLQFYFINCTKLFTYWLNVYIMYTYEQEISLCMCYTVTIKQKTQSLLDECSYSFNPWSCLWMVKFATLQFICYINIYTHTYMYIHILHMYIKDALSQVWDNFCQLKFL